MCGRHSPTRMVLEVVFVRLLTDDEIAIIKCAFRHGIDGHLAIPH